MAPPKMRYPWPAIINIREEPDSSKLLQMTVHEIPFTDEIRLRGLGTTWDEEYLKRQQGSCDVQPRKTPRD